MRNPRLLGAAAVAAVALVPAASAQAKPTITLSGSTSIAPLAGGLIKGYLKQFPGSASFRLFQGGSDVGINDVARGRVTIGDSSRDPLSSDPGGITFNKIARDAVCIATNPANPLGNLSQAQVQAIFSGTVRNWNQVPGAKVTGPIQLQVRTQASGTQDAFQQIFMGTRRVSGNAATRASNGLVQQSIKSNKQAIGYVSFDFAKGLSPATYQGVACNLRNAKSNQYLGTRNFWMVTRGSGKPGGAPGKFIKWVQKSPKAKKITSTNWVPLG